MSQDRQTIMPADAGTASGASTANRGPARRVLLVDDQRIIVEALRRILTGEDDIAFHAVLTADEALPAALQWQPTVILQDLVMPSLSGFELVQRFRSHPQTQDVPIIVLSTREDAQLKADAFAVGANDYLVKLPDRRELLARLRYHSDACRSRRERDEAFRTLRESERKLAEANAALQKLSEMDGLTGIANRRRFDEALQLEWQRAARTRQPLSLLLCDVDYFKQFNDLYGHVLGDRCLQQIASALNSLLRRPADVTARYGGEEFALILPETDSEGGLAVAESCRQKIVSLAIPHAHSPHDGVATVSIGVATILPTPGTLPYALVSSADQALYKAKLAGRNRAIVSS